MLRYQGMFINLTYFLQLEELSNNEFQWESNSIATVKYYFWLLQDNLQDNLNKLRRLAAERTRNLEHSKSLHAYMRESEEFEEWIGEQMQTASSEEYGQDYEHLQVI